MLRSMKCVQRLVRTLLFAVTGGGTAAIGEGKFHGTLTDNGTGDYTITFANPFSRAPIVSIAVLTADCVHQISSVSKTAVRVKLFDATDGTTAKDGDFHLTVHGFDATDQG